jgi:hypothetical protein
MLKFSGVGSSQCNFIGYGVSAMLSCFMSHAHFLVVDNVELWGFVMILGR